MYLPERMIYKDEDKETENRNLFYSIVAFCNLLNENPFH